MTVISAPRVMPRSVRYLMSSLERSAVWGAIKLSPSRSLGAFARRGRRRVPANCLPTPLVEYPDVRQQHAIFDNSTEIFDPRAREHGTDKHAFECGRSADFQLNPIDIAALNRLEPFFATHHEGARRAGADEDEVRMDHRPQALHVPAAQCVAPLALEAFNQLTTMLRHAFPFAPSLGWKQKKASRRNEGSYRLLSSEPRNPRNAGRANPRRE